MTNNTSEQVDRAPELQYYLPQAPYDEPQVKTTQAIHQSTTQRTTEELRQLFGRGRGKTRQHKLHSHHPYGACTRSLQAGSKEKLKRIKNSDKGMQTIHRLYNYHF